MSAVSLTSAVDFFKGRSVRNLGSILIFAVLVVVVSGLTVIQMRRLRDATALAYCQATLKQIGVALDNYQSTQKHFPTGTVGNMNRSPDKRFSWLTELYPAYMEAGPVMLFDKSQTWDSPVNCPPRGRLIDCGDLTIVRDNYVVGELRQFQCPVNVRRSNGILPGLSDYVGIAGVGHAAAELPLGHPRAGFFGYERKVTMADLTQGTATTIVAAETLQPGFWIAGGSATVRALSGDKPYFGAVGPFGSQHGDGSNVLFADVSVRVFNATANANQIRAMATLTSGGSR